MYNNRESMVAISFLIASVGLSGCTNYYHKKDSYSESGLETLSIDAKQRVLFFTDRNGNRVTCAEPSPDALSALSSSFGTSIQTNSQVAANLAAAVTESAASIGLRTQSIQLLRDGMYRICEAYASGAIDSDEYNRQQRRYQNLMLSLLAIEQITGATVAKQVGLGGGSASTSVGVKANEAAAELAQAEKDLEKAKTQLDTLVKKRDSDAEKCGEITDETEKEKDSSCINSKENVTNVEKQEAVVATAEKKRDTAKIALNAARSAIASSTEGASVKFDSGCCENPKITDASVRYIAEAARTIVSTTLLASFAQEECSRLWDQFEPTMLSSDLVEKFLKKNQVPSGLAKNLSKSKEVRKALENETKLVDAVNLFLTKKSIPSVYGAQYTAIETSIKQAVEMALKAQGQPVFITTMQLAGIPEEKSEKLLNQLASNCADSGDKFLIPEMYIPNYYDSKPLPLKVLSDADIKIVAGNKLPPIRIIGGEQPYSISTGNSIVGFELPENSNMLTLDATNSSAGTGKLYVIDKADSYVVLNITVTKPTK